MTLQQALELHQAGRHEEAERAYREHLAENPQDADALHLLGVLRQQRHDSDGALELIRQALALAPERAQYHLSLGGTLLRTGDLAAARASFERALEIDPNSIEAHGLLGHLALQAGDHDDAENRFLVGRRAEAEDPLILFGLGSIHLDRGDPINAAKFLGRAAQLKPDDAAIQTAFGRALFMQSAFGLAEQAFLNALKLRPDLGVAKLFLARTRMRQNKLESARELFAELLAAGVQTQFAHAGLGDVARHQGRFVHALKHYRRVLEVDPGHVGASVASASCMEQIGDLDGATRFLAAGLRHAPQSDLLRRPLAELLDRLGRGDEAAQVRAAGGAAAAGAR